jgi:hypothetical protein
MKNLKSKGYENCSTEHMVILTHFGENFIIFLIKLPFTETVFHILNRNLPQGTKVWPPGSLDINPFDYLKCGVSRRGINRPSHKKNSPWSPPSWRFSATSPGRPPRGPAALSGPG